MLVKIILANATCINKCPRTAFALACPVNAFEAETLAYSKLIVSCKLSCNNKSYAAQNGQSRNRLNVQ